MLVGKKKAKIAQLITLIAATHEANSENSGKLIIPNNNNKFS